MLEITRATHEMAGTERHVWEVIVGVRGSGPQATVHVQVCGYRREMRRTSGTGASAWRAVAYWSPCTGPSCRVPTVLAIEPPPVKLESMPVLKDAEMLKAVRAKMEISWS